jgi:hypothetical protein
MYTSPHFDCPLPTAYLHFPPPTSTAGNYNKLPFHFLSSIFLPRFGRDQADQLCTVQAQRQGMSDSLVSYLRFLTLHSLLQAH